ESSAGTVWSYVAEALRAYSALKPRRIVWNGAAVRAAVPSTLAPGTPLMAITSPAGISGNYAVGTASFGPALIPGGLTGTVVAAADPSDSTGASTTDACSALTNASEVAGKIALVDRGTCTFVVKARNCQSAGAIAVLV